MTRVLCSFYRKGKIVAGIIVTVVLLYLQSLLRYMVPEAVHMMEAGIIIYTLWPGCSSRLQKDSYKG